MAPGRPLFLSCAFCLLATRVNALTINFVEDAANPLSAQAWQGFQTAASLWESKISSSVTLNIDVGMRNFGSGSSNTIGQAGSDYYRLSYADFRQVVTQNATSANDYAFLSTLPTGSTYSRLINQTNDTPGPDYYATWVDTQSQIYISGGNAKALGLLVPGTSDAFIEFNSAFAFDYNRADGIAFNQMDFIGAAAHEIGHALGFTSIVDFIDIYGGNANFFLSTPLDFMRYSSASSALGISDVSAGKVEKYLKVGSVVLPMSTGTSLGDGQQASHFKDNISLGIMDPTVSYGEMLSITSNDLLIMDALGWRVPSIPEPSTYGLGLGLASLSFAFGRRQHLKPKHSATKASPQER